MKRIRSKKKVISITIIIVLVILVVAVTNIRKSIVRKKEYELRMEQRKIAEAYSIVNSTFEIAVRYGAEKYYPLKSNEYGISPLTYISLGMYEIETGIILPYKIVIDYFSQEYESDGTLRLYDNGLHPDIEKYVIWADSRYDAMEEHIYRIEMIYIDYEIDNEKKGYNEKTFWELSPQALDELAKKVADPDYKLDLIELQKQGY